jgi:hypothetical protein
VTQTTATQRGSEQADAQFNTDRTYPGRWTITFSNPPINIFVPKTIVELDGPVREGRSVPVGESRFFHRPSRRSQGS